MICMNHPGASERFIGLIASSAGLLCSQALSLHLARSVIGDDGANVYNLSYVFVHDACYIPRVINLIKLRLPHNFNNLFTGHGPLQIPSFGSFLVLWVIQVILLALQHLPLVPRMRAQHSGADRISDFKHGSCNNNGASAGSRNRSLPGVPALNLLAFGYAWLH